MNSLLTVAKSYGSPALAASTGSLAALGTTHILPAIGFCTAGVKAGSIAAGVQAMLYGAAVPAGSAFAILQSWGATGALAGTLGVVAVPVGVAVGGATYIVASRLAA